MTTTVTSVFNDSLDITNGSRSDAFTNADYAVVIAPLIEGQGDDFQVDTFLQLEFNNRNRLIPLQPINLLDTNNISIIPFPFKAGNEFNLYFFMLASQPVNVEVLVVSNEDDNWQEVKDKLEEIEDSTNQDKTDINDTLRTIIDILRLSGGDATAIISLFGDFIGEFNELEGIDLPLLPSGTDTIQEITQFYGL
jgi:hypothetical protein